VKDDDVVDDQLSVGAELLGDAVLARVALGLHLVEINLGPLLNSFFAKNVGPNKKTNGMNYNLFSKDARAWERTRNLSTSPPSHSGFNLLRNSNI
jgi:hypothetical protein